MSTPAEIATVTQAVRASLAKAGFRGWRLGWTAFTVTRDVINGKRVAVLSLRPRPAPIIGDQIGRGVCDDIKAP